MSSRPSQHALRGRTLLLWHLGAAALAGRGVRVTFGGSLAGSVARARDPTRRQAPGFRTARIFPFPLALRDS
jgi:hypothetical protein